MARLEVRDIWSNTIIQPNDDVFVVLDNRMYSIAYYSETDITSCEVYLEDDILSGVHYSIDNRELSIDADKLFIDSRGVVDLKINGEEFSFDVLSNKLSYSKIEKMILYLYEQDDQLIYSFLSRNKSKVQKVVKSKSDIPLSAKYIKKLISILDKYEKLLPRFIAVPHTIIRKKEVMCDYGEDSRDYDINWLLCNLDDVDINDLYQQYPASIDFGDEYGWITKIKATDNVITYNNYENCVILGGLLKIKNEINSANKEISSIIRNEVNKSNSRYVESDQCDYVCFSDIKCVHLQKINKDLSKLENRVAVLLSKYESLFKGVNKKDALECSRKLKYTPVFKSFMHYREIFGEILWLYNNKYNLDGELDLLGLKKVSQLYELFCHLQLRDGLRHVCNDNFFEDNNKFIHKQTNNVISLFYQPRITKTYDGNSEIELVAIGNYSSSHYIPDFVIKIELSTNVKYIILDAKYSRMSSVKKYALEDCALKYLMDIGIYNERYKKADYLFILNPESNFDNAELYYENAVKLINSDYLPRIGSFCVTPSSNLEFIVFMMELLKNKCGII